MKTNLIQTCLLAALLALPAVVQAQFNYTTNNGTITITGYTGPGGDVTILDNINGLPVTGIGDYAFYYCTSLANVTIGGSVFSIGQDAFADCYSLTSVTIPDSVTSIGFEGFADCISLVSITIPTGVSYIGEYAFADCDSLSNVYFKGDAPVPDGTWFIIGDVVERATAYYLPGTTGWADFSATTGVRAVPWQPLIQTDDGNFGVRTNQFGFNISWASGQTVVVEACTNLANPVWVPVATNTLTGDSSYFSDPQSSNSPARFYRLRSP